MWDTEVQVTALATLALTLTLALTSAQNARARLRDLFGEENCIVSWCLVVISRGWWPLFGIQFSNLMLGVGLEWILLLANGRWHWPWLALWANRLCRFHSSCSLDINLFLFVLESVSYWWVIFTFGNILPQVQPLWLLMALGKSDTFCSLFFFDRRPPL